MKWYLKMTAVGAVALMALSGCSSHGKSTTKSDGPTSPAQTTTAAPTPSASTPAASGPGAFGTLGEVCGAGDAKGATDVGVSDTSIKVATIADVGWTSAPGLLQPIFDGADAFVDWCNAAGGINGRKLDLEKRDSAYSNYLPQIKTSCTNDLAVVGSMGILDDTGVDAWEKCGLLNYTAATVGSKAANAKLMFPMTPIPADQQTIGGFHLLFEQHPEWAQAVGSLYSNGAAGDREQHTYNEAIENIGGKIVYSALYTPTTSNWTPYVQAMKKAGVKFLFMNVNTSVTAGVQQAMATLDWYPEFQISPPQLYDENVLKLAGKNIKNYYTYIPTTPYESADTVPAVKQYLEIMTQYAPKAKKTFFGATAFSGWLLFAEGVKSCGSQVTRVCVAEYAQKQTAWTGGGLQGPIDVATRQASECFIVMKIEPDKFVQAYPATTGAYDCSPKNAPTVKP